MTTTLIRIDRASIKRNPNAGATTSFIGSPVTKSRIVRRNEGGRGIEEQQEWAGEWITSRSESSSRPFPAAAVGVFDEREDREVATVHHMPIPPWSYRYVPTPVTCRNCGATFPHTELDSDSFPDGEGGETFVEDICPKCGEADCCDVTFEKIEDVIRAQRAGIDKP